MTPREYPGSSGYSQGVPRQMIGLHLAAYFGVTGVITALLNNRHHVNIKDGWDRTPLSLAAENGHEAMVKLLLEKGSELVSKENLYGQMPLLLAAQGGHEAVVKLLLKNGAELDPKDGWGRTSLSLAAEKGHRAVVELLLEKGANLESKDASGKTPLHWAVRNGHEEVMTLLTSYT